MNQETRELLSKSLEISRKVIHVGWIPFILFMGITNSATRPSILKIISPFAA
jgi:import receptor subunit TOM7